MKTRYYCASEDHYGVLEVTALENPRDEEIPAALAERFPETIYFAVDPPPLQDFTFTVTVRATTKEQAEMVMGNRLNVNEDYGFDYSIPLWERA